MLNSAQIDALEGVAGRALTDAELADLTPLVEIRNDVAIAGLLSIGRVELFPRTITSRGVRAALPIKDAVDLLILLRDAAAMAPTPPDWLVGALTAAGVPEDEHPAYADTMACAHGWLAQEAGIDLGAQTARDMLDLIAMSNPARFGAAVAKLKTLAERPGLIDCNAVSNALNVAEGRMTL